ncbi:MAG: hypothetical protein EOM40_17905 [Clostridia bacterium]|nr:hypothetical protein [Clostridia bacterium]NCC43265.1 hypothetical protein [Clostridia bacterium]
MDYFIQMFGVSLAVTLIIEIIAAYLMGVRKRKGIVVVILVNILTNPAAVLLAWLGSQHIQKYGDTFVQIPIELVVIFIEAAVYRSYAKAEEVMAKHPIFLSVTANLCSWGTGVLIQLTR